MSFSDLSEKFRQKREAKEQAETQAKIAVDPQEVFTVRARITGVLLRDARLAKGYSSEQLAVLMQVNHEVVLAWEFGQLSPTLPQLEMLAYLLEVPVSHFLSGTETLLQKVARRQIDQGQYQSIRDHMIGAEIRYAREQAGYTITYLAEKSALDADTLQAYEFGHMGVPMPHLVSLASALQVSVSYFLEGSDRVGAFLQAQEAFDAFLKMEPELREFIANPSSHPYIALAMRLAALKTEKLRDIAEHILEITY